MSCENCKKRFEEGFDRGQESANKSGCCCIINDDGEVVDPCGAHLIWLDDQLGNKRCGC